jgi:hypothetical protein
MKHSLAWFSLFFVAACSGPTFRYEAVDPNSNTADPPGALRFSLQKLSILVDKPRSTLQPAPAKPTNAPTPAKSNDNNSTSNSNSGTVGDHARG